MGSRHGRYRSESRRKERLQSWPRVSGVKSLRGDLAGHFRIRTGDYRIQFRLEGKTLIVERIGHRDGFYEDWSMVTGTIELEGKRFVVVPEEEYDRLCQRAALAGDIELPGLPAPDVAALRAGLARKLIRRRWSVGLSQVEVARRAGIRPETLNRIERVKVTADTRTISKIVKVLEKAERRELRR